MKTKSKLMLCFALILVPVLVPVGIYFAKKQNIHLLGSVGAPGVAVYAFPEEIIPSKDRDNPSVMRAFFARLPLDRAIAQTQTDPKSGGFGLSIPKISSSQDVNLVVVPADGSRRYWIVRISKFTLFALWVVRGVSGSGGEAGWTLPNPAIGGALLQA
jgi:hypothetical protein